MNSVDGGIYDDPRGSCVVGQSLCDIECLIGGSSVHPTVKSNVTATIGHHDGDGAKGRIPSQLCLDESSSA
ncbi:hypothetical protein HMPREF9344_01974 [Cutibacterium acnes HL097PA1]|nr:hypothetical protein HMPREF9344_01974 [Cutibacterium acnes HL097PA1]